MATLLHRLGLASVRHRIVVTVVWLLALVAVGVGAATLSGTTANTFSIPGQESTKALDLMKEKFGAASAGATVQVVFEAPAGETVTSQDNAAQIAKTVASLGQVPGVVSVSNPLDEANPAVSRDQVAAYSTVTFDVQPSLVTDEQRESIIDKVEDARSFGMTVEAEGEALSNPADIGGASEILGVVVALIVLALTYGSLVAAGMNLLTAIVGVGIGAAGIVTLTGFVDLQSTTPILAVMLGLAVGIDYALFIVTRFRHELRRGLPVEESAAMAVGTAGSAVVTAGLTVVIALAGLSVVGIPFLTEMGLAAAATIVIAVLVAITLVPAILGFIGLRALPKKQRGVHGDVLPDGRGFIKGWADLVTRQRTISLVLAVAALAVIAIPFFSMQTTLNQRAAEGSTQAKAQAIIDSRFGPGVSSPLLVLVDGPDAVQYATTVQKQVASLPDVALATPAQPNQDQSAALITIIPASGPEDQKTVDLVHAIRDTVPDADGAEVYVTGNTAVSIDVSQKLNDALPVYLALVVGLAFVLLVLVFRSILVPVVGVLGFLLTIGAAFGATVAVFQWGWAADAVNAGSTGPILSLAPIIIVGILFGLAMDYQVFLVSRMHEAHAHGASPRDAIVTGFRQAAPVVVAAATIMFAVFAAFVPEGNDTIKPIAFALAVGIAFDAFIVRMIAVPAALALLGRSAWWLPSWLRWLPELDVEGAALERKPSASASSESSASRSASPSGASSAGSSVSASAGSSAGSPGTRVTPEPHADSADTASESTSV
ncbi:putative integral membrane protein [Actinoplanes missouriensis 431]|uniref:Putative integral membrane protein n=1 Tax=Actinoplanes missouriensis (strain ATCC 14538 / DSM 43046 / CBS 188.64 / JCM 3121 / NBRC 102363 / NCIMB 12654 / NRRL B-3342 / UNCC 431) TaxID=512565 RepID=I0HCP1_ACTM4|nr:MMPL family transporter [Actinoplanes missouriensis]BAL90778.1 putative integral membrane protein [Actinoplanes missouriensis 431]